MKIMVVGGGGREHAIIKKLKESKKVEKIFALPGNGGMAEDATLIDMCKKLPTTTEELLEVSGVGKVKLELYGDRFLQMLKSYCNYNKKSDSND